MCSMFNIHNSDSDVCVLPTVHWDPERLGGLSLLAQLGFEAFDNRNVT